MDLALQAIALIQFIHDATKQVSENDEIVKELFRRVGSLDQPINNLMLNEHMSLTQQEHLQQTVQLVIEIKEFAVKYIKETEAARFSFAWMFSNGTRLIRNKSYKQVIANFSGKLDQSLRDLTLDVSAKTLGLVAQLLSNQGRSGQLAHPLVTSAVLPAVPPAPDATALNDVSPPVTATIDSVAVSSPNSVSVALSPNSSAKEAEGTKDVYEGETKNGLYHGKGRMVYANGDTYDGDWWAGMRHGDGTATYVPTGRWTENRTIIAFTGHFADDEPDGMKIVGLGVIVSQTISHGLIRYQDGSVYEGDVCQGLPINRGKRTYANGYVYEGEFEEDTPHGHGVLWHPNGHHYEGEFADGEKFDNGVETFPPGTAVTMYKGLYANNLPDGSGALLYANGNWIEGEWKDGELVRVHRTGIFNYGVLDISDFHSTTNQFFGTATTSNGTVTHGSWSFDTSNGVFSEWQKKSGSI